LLLLDIGQALLAKRSKLEESDEIEYAVTAYSQTVPPQSLLIRQPFSAPMQLSTGFVSTVFERIVDLWSCQPKER
jgi:hypothetical protein